MTDAYNNQGNRKTTADLGTYDAADEAPRNISRATWLMIGAGILFVIIAAFLIFSYLNNPTGGATNLGSGASSQTR